MDQNQQSPNEQGPHTQAEIDEIQKQIKLNNDFENEMKKEIAEQMPFISAVLPTEDVLNEYIETKFEESFRALIRSRDQGGRGYAHIRRLRRDGNCFYRSFLFQLFEYYALNLKDPAVKGNYDKLIKIVTESKDDLVANAGYDEIVIEDFYDTFLGAVKKLEEMPKLHQEHLNEKKDQSLDFSSFVHEELEKMLCNMEEALYIIMYARFMAACHLKKNAIMFEDFLGGDVAGFCVREVEQVDVECDHPQIIAITNYLEHGVEINGIMQNKAEINVTNIPHDDFPGNSFRVKLLFVPGHYDALYD